MVLTFALCATFVFAQTATPKMKEIKAPTKAAQVQNDYSSSIFTKDAAPIVYVDFSAENSGYSTGVVTGGLEGHAESYGFATWHRWANVEDSTLVAASETYPALTQAFGGPTQWATAMRNRLDTTVSSAENGFMMMSLYDQRTPFSGNFNAFIRIDNIDASDAEVLDVEFYQFYNKYYDNCYIDYSINNGTSWNEMEINVNGVDMGINDISRGMVRYTLPTSAVGHTISIRIRYKALDASRESYGYWWMLDDVSVYACEANRVKAYAQEFVEGNYALIPQNMTINPAWYSKVLNNGAYDQTNLTVDLYHIDAFDQSSIICSYNNGTLPLNTRKEVIADLRGWLLPDSLGYRGWYEYSPFVAHGSGTALPTATAGDNYMYAKISNDSISYTYDTMYYQVTTANSANEYRWGHDNGVLTYSPSNYYLFGYVQGADGNWYVTEDPQDVHFYDAGYYLNNRYTTDAVVPEGWAILGAELVASPANGFHSTGAKISPILFKDAYTGGSVEFHSVNTGANVKTITDADVNDSTVIGRLSNGYREMGQYNTVYIPFPEQPALEPNTSYRVGYVMEEDGYFAVAQEAQGSYRLASPTRDGYDTIIYFGNSDATAKWAHNFLPNQYQVFMHDPSYGGTGNGSTFASWYVETYCPMIRLVVGPAREVARRNIKVECENTEYGEAAYAGHEVCGTTITPAEGSSAQVTGTSAEGAIVSQVIVDGEVVEPYNEETETGDPNFTLSHDTTGGVNVWVAIYTFPNITEDHTIKFVFEEAQSIDPVAANVRMKLQPNPATSQVKLNIEGVEGMVNCMLIDMSGRVVYNQNLNAASEQTINVSNLAKGAYFVRITNDKFSKVEKLIVR